MFKFCQCVGSASSLFRTYEYNPAFVMNRGVDSSSVEYLSITSSNGDLANADCCMTSAYCPFYVGIARDVVTHGSERLACSPDLLPTILTCVRDTASTLSADRLFERPPSRPDRPRHSPEFATHPSTHPPGFLTRNRHPAQQRAPPTTLTFDTAHIAHRNISQALLTTHTSDIP